MFQCAVDLTEAVMFWWWLEGGCLKIVGVFLPKLQGFNHLSTFMAVQSQVLVENHFLCMVG